MGNKYTLEFQADAIIAQKGTEAEKIALKNRLASEISSWGNTLGETSVERVMNKLSRQDLGNAEVRNQIMKFIEEERKLKGGYMGEDFEVPARIFERYYGLAQNANNLRDSGRQAVTAQAAEEVRNVQGSWQNPNAPSVQVPGVTVPLSATPVQPTTTPPAQPASTRSAGGVEVTSKNESIERIQAANVKFIDANKSELQKILNEGRKKYPEQGVNRILDSLEAVLKDPKNFDEISKLQGLLMDAGKQISGNGSTDGQFGNMTLNAVRGVFGVKESGGVSVPSKPQAAATGGGSASQTPQKPGLQPPAVSTPAPSVNTPAYDEKDSKEQKAYLVDKQAIEQAYKAWQESTKKAKSEIFSSEKEIADFSNTNDTFLKALFEKMSTFEQKHITGKKHTLVQSGNEYTSQLRNEVAAYYRGVGSVDNKHYKNPLIALSLLAGNLSMKLPAFPDQNTLLKDLSEEKKQQLLTLVNAKMQGDTKKSFAVALGEVLGNPMIKGSWDKVQKDALEKYNKDIVASIEKVDASKLNSEQKASLAQLKDMYGVGGVLWGAFNWKDENSQTFGMMRDQLFALGLGVAGFAATSTGIGAVGGVPMMAYAGAALVGGILTTTASATLEGREYGLGKFTRETAINAATFGAGGFVFKTVRAAEMAGRIGVGTAIAAEGAGDVVIGVSIDQTRAYFEGIDVGLIQSFQENLAWALLPIAIRGGSQVKGLFSEKRKLFAQNTAARADEAHARQALGDTAGAEAVMRNADAEIQAARREAGEGVQSSQVPPVSPNQQGSIIGSALPDSGNTPTTQPRAAQKASRPRHGYTEEQITANKTLTPEARLVKAEEVVGSPLTDIQKTAIMDAHAANSITKKARILERAGFDVTQRGKLLESGVCGVSDAVIAGARNFRENVTSTPLDKLGARFKDSINGLKDGASLEIADIKITRQGSGFILKQEGKEPISYTRTKQGTEAMVQVVDSRISPADYIQLATNDAINGMLSKNLGKEITSEGATFRLRKEGDAKIFEKKLDDGGFQKMTEAEITGLSPAQVNDILGKMTSKNTMSWIKDHAGKPFQDTPSFEKIKDLSVKEFFKKMGHGAEHFALHTGNAKDYNWIGAKIPKYMYDWSIGKMISEMGHSLHLPGLQKVEVLRTMITGRSAHGNFWSNNEHAHTGTNRLHFTSPSTWIPNAWLPSGQVVGTTALITGAELAFAPDSDHRTLNQFLGDEVLSNYFNFIWFGALGSAIVEWAETKEIAKESGSAAAGVGKWAVDKIGTDGGEGAKTVADGVISTAKDGAGAVTDLAKGVYSKIGSDGKK